MEPFCIIERPGPILAAAIHAGHEVRPEVAALLAMSDSDRMREEDPFTDRLLPSSASHIVVTRSRFEVDMNRARDAAVYLTPEDAWGLRVWATPVPEDVAERSRELHDRFRDRVEAFLAEKVRRHGGFVLLDIHAYNHRRSGPTGEPADPAENPEVNIGTGTLDRVLWAPVIDGFSDSLRSRGFDVRENVKFRGGDFGRWVNERFAAVGCSIAIEFKKTFVDEWTGTPDDAAMERIRLALSEAAAAAEGALDARNGSPDDTGDHA